PTSLDWIRSRSHLSTAMIWASPAFPRALDFPPLPPNGSASLRLIKSEPYNSLHTKQWKSGNPISKHKDRSNLKKQKSKPRGTVAHSDLIGGDISRGMLAMIEAQVR